MSNQLEQELTPLLEPLYRYAMALTASDSDASDLVQETMLRAVRNRSRFLGLENKRAWLFKVLSNVHLDSIRKRKRHLIANSKMQLHQNLVAAPETTPSSANENQKKILDMFQALPDVQRKVMYLRCVEECSVRQIAETLGTTENNVKANLSIARKKIRAKLKKTDDEVVKR